MTKYTGVCTLWGGAERAAISSAWKREGFGGT